MNTYEKWREAEHIRRLAVNTFGQDSFEADRMRNLSRYWWDSWYKEDCPVGIATEEEVREMIRKCNLDATEHRISIVNRFIDLDGNGETHDNSI